MTRSEAASEEATRLAYVDSLTEEEREDEDSGYTECEKCGRILAIIGSTASAFCPDCDPDLDD